PDPAEHGEDDHRVAIRGVLAPLAAADERVRLRVDRVRSRAEAVEQHLALVDLELGAELTGIPEADERDLLGEVAVDGGYLPTGPLEQRAEPRLVDGEGVERGEVARGLPAAVPVRRQVP